MRGVHAICCEYIYIYIYIYIYVVLCFIYLYIYLFIFIVVFIFVFIYLFLFVLLDFFFCFHFSAYLFKNERALALAQRCAFLRELFPMPAFAQRRATEPTELEAGERYKVSLHCIDYMYFVVLYTYAITRYARIVNASRFPPRTWGFRATS